MTREAKVITAKVRFGPGKAPDFYAISGPVCWCLRQADVHILSQDLGFDGDSMRIETDHGIIEMQSSPFGKGSEVAIAVRAADTVEGLVARQLCYELAKRISMRLSAASILWKPTSQVLRPTQFTWAVLQEMPRRLPVSGRISPEPMRGALLH
ncbi:hypothetical protein SAMN04488012_10770 [Palleronia salina]|uniref:Uncharacterized protein n=1 Tax=Palleronia salina TaxID=313368 RepID=A0A1M6I8P7_9RHOB|nr:hypothetical protein [Palleronia salina]SHJ30787.1 hypothetical protein SAMN04488012_10770 [Palleronia salina]